MSGYFHISQADLGNCVVFSPRVPLHLYKNYRHAWYFKLRRLENNTIKRICVSRSLCDCIKAHLVNKNKPIYVYKVYSCMHRIYIPTTKLVYDVKHTNECWLRHRVKLIKVKTIINYKIANVAPTLNIRFLAKGRFISLMQQKLVSYNHFDFRI